jgi:two-component system sensor histidine kinase YesM
MAKYVSKHENQEAIATVFFSISLVSLSLIGFLSYRLSSGLTRGMIRNYAFETVIQLSNNIDAMLEQIETMSLSIAYDGNIQAILNRWPRAHSVSRSDLFTIEQRMISSYDYETMRDITIITSNDSTFRVPYSLSQAESRSQYPTNLKLPPTGCVWINNPQYGIIQMMRGIDSTQSFQRIGTLGLSIYSSTINKMVANINFDKHGYITILDDHFNPIASTNNQLHWIAGSSAELSGNSGSFTKKIAGQTILFFYDTSQKTGWKTVGNISINHLYHKVNAIGMVIFLWMLPIFLLILIISDQIAYLFSKKINQVVERMRHVSEGDFSVQLPVDLANEFGELNRGFNTMVQKINTLIATVYKARLLQKNSELKALQAQINPHFLYNTLDAICWQAKLYHCDEISRTVIALANLLRVSVDNRDSFITIQAEINYIMDYVLIQRARYRDKIQVNIDIDAAIKPLLIPKLIVQPVVENAFIHGLEMKKGKGALRIRGQRDNGRVLFEVEDDGVGMSPEQINRIFHEKDILSHSSMGLMNVHRRIQLIYGESYGLEVESHPGAGTLVRIILLAEPPSDQPTIDE